MGKDKFPTLTIPADIYYNITNLSDFKRRTYGKDLSEKCYDKEEYIDTGCIERRWVVQIFMKGLWK